MPPKNAPVAKDEAEAEETPEAEDERELEEKSEPEASKPDALKLITGFSSQVQSTFQKWQDDAQKRNEDFKAKFAADQDKLKAHVQENNEKIKNFFDNLGKKWNDQVKPGKRT
ncbi:MAG TPA: hypothetical protein VKK79_02785 [Candidatus Lokiarchaeia archaeon]|nr:hypothetical protein [Candidatus Lokiarchaeia archaeon]